MNNATGEVAAELIVTYPVRVIVLLPAVFDAVRVTVYVPAAEYVWIGLCTVDVPPSPNDHDHEVGEFDDKSMNWTLNGAVPVVRFETNDATGTDSAAHAGMNNAPRMMRRSPAITGFARALFSVSQ